LWVAGCAARGDGVKGDLESGGDVLRREGMHSGLGSPGPPLGGMWGPGVVPAFREGTLAVSARARCGSRRPTIDRGAGRPGLLGRMGPLSGGDVGAGPFCVRVASIAGRPPARGEAASHNVGGTTTARQTAWSVTPGYAPGRSGDGSAVLRPGYAPGHSDLFRARVGATEDAAVGCLWGVSSPQWSPAAASRQSRSDVFRGR